MYDRNALIAKLEELPFSKDEYWLAGGGAMALYNFREQTRDIDLGGSTQLIDKLASQGYETSYLNGVRRIMFSDDIEIFENWIEDCVEFVNNIPVVSIKGLIAMKQKLGREKDLADLELIRRKDLLL